MNGHRYFLKMLRDNISAYSGCNGTIALQTSTSQAPVPGFGKGYPMPFPVSWWRL